MFAATRSRSASSSTMQASFPPNSIWRGIMPAFFEIEIPVSPPVKLRENNATYDSHVMHQSIESKDLMKFQKRIKEWLITLYSSHQDAW